MILEIRNDKTSNKIMTLLMCVAFGIILFWSTPQIEATTRDAVTPLISYNIVDISSDNVDKIDNQFNTIINSNPKVDALLFYRFVTKRDSIIYSGRVGVTEIVRDGLTITDFKANVIPMNSSNKVQSILLNKPYYHVYNRSQCRVDLECDGYPVSDTIKAVISFPILDQTDYTVKAYITVLLNTKLDDKQIYNLTTEMQPYLNNISSLMN